MHSPEVFPELKQLCTRSLALGLQDTCCPTVTPHVCCCISDADGTLPLHLASASSDGVVKLWDTRMLSSSGACQELAALDTRARITCMAAADTRKTAKAPQQAQQQMQPAQKQKQRQQQQQLDQQQQQRPVDKVGYCLRISVETVTCCTCACAVCTPRCCSGK